MIVRTLLIAAALLGGTAQAAESTDLCGANLQKLDDILAVRGKTSVTGARVTEVKELQAKARQPGQRRHQGLHHRHHPSPADPAEHRQEMIRDRRKADNRKRLSVLPQCDPPQGE